MSKQSTITRFFRKTNDDSNSTRNNDGSSVTTIIAETSQQCSYIESLQYEMLSEMAKLDEFKFNDSAVDRFFKVIDADIRAVSI